ncbi:rhomboid family intramembrane serine protease [Nannocystis bainbridge]|uniref:Rhomboid family intramembrane serine protease n=1 Tax=Nannocystis bainbridge TaxID=2995303 RepID=A0ABT5EDH6_9BACT|nr:rhomboid family intramembrane serine protease [Nannocystis bainbridge]MDC0722973.1 rhomboid family intramembrane serine protease [Nannocystis bainbridge]
MPIDALALPLLIVTAIGLFGYALYLRRVGLPHARTGWLLVAFIVLAAALAWWIEPVSAGFVAFGLYLLFIIAPVSLQTRLHRAIGAGDEVRARRLAWVLARIHPTRVVREELAALPTILALRAGDDVPPAELDRVSHGLPQVRRAFDIVLLHNRRDVDAVKAAFADPEERAGLFAQGLGAIYVQSVACTDPSGDALAEALARALAGDPTFQQLERLARLVIQAHALAGDVARTCALADGLGMYLARGDRELCVALAEWCAGRPDAARRTLARALEQHGEHRIARSTLASLDAMIVRRPPRPATTPSPALDHRLAALRRGAPTLRAVSTFLGRHAIRPRLTWAWMAVLVGFYAIYASVGDPYDTEHAYAWGALYTGDFGPSEVWRLGTLTLLHVGVLHLALNVLMLWRFGTFVEVLFGRARLAAIYVLSAALSGLAVALLRDPASPLLLIGASGAIMALGGAVIAALLLRRDLRSTPIGRTELVALAILFGLQVVFDSFTPEVSGTAHAAGIAAGVVLGALFLPRHSRAFADMLK